MKINGKSINTKSFRGAVSEWKGKRKNYMNCKA